MDHEPDGHDTPDSMNHYSREETAVAESMEYPRAAATIATKVTTTYKISGAVDETEFAGIVNTGDSSSKGGEDGVSTSMRGS